MKILLDTCTFIWIVEGSAQLSPVAIKLFQNPEHDVFLSSISVWEILVKHRLGKLNLSLEPEEYITDGRRKHRIVSLPLHEGHTFHLARLPDHHRDPFDRMLICQAIEAGLVILTPDANIKSYPVNVKW